MSRELHQPDDPGVPDRDDAACPVCDLLAIMLVASLISWAIWRVVAFVWRVL